MTLEEAHEILREMRDYREGEIIALHASVRDMRACADDAASTERKHTALQFVSNYERTAARMAREIQAIKTVMEGDEHG